MSLRRAILALGAMLVATALPAVSAHAQALFTLPGDVRLVEVDDAASPVLGTDRQGYVWAYGGGGIVCYDPANRAATQRAFGAFDHPGIANGAVWVDTHWDGAVSFEGGYTPNPDFEPGGPQALFQRYDCTSSQPLPAPERVALQLPEGRALPGDSAFDAPHAFRRGAELCSVQNLWVPTRLDPRPTARVMCVDFPAGALATGAVVLSDATLDATLGVPSWAATYPEQPEEIEYAFGGSSGQSYIGPPFEGWNFAAPIVTPGGRVFFIATRQTAIYNGGPRGAYGHTGWILELLGDQTVHAWLAPKVVRAPGSDSFGGSLMWHEPSRSLMASVSGSMEFGNYVQCAGDGFGNTECAPHGPGGLGFWTMSLDAPGVGYLSIRDAYDRAVRCRSDATHTGCTMYPPNIVADPAGRVIFAATERRYNQPNALGPWEDVVDTVRRFRLDFDPSTFDMDGDGLTRAEEDALGTSDYAIDSDHGYTTDAVEAGIDATDPAVGSDDTTHVDQDLDAEPRGFGTSRLVRAWLPQDVSDSDGGRVQSLSPDGPLCFRGRCLDIHQQVVLTYPTDGISNVAVSADGRFIAWREGTAFKRKIFAEPDADAETFVASGELERFIGATTQPAGTFFPISPTLSYWVQTTDPPRVVAFDGAGTGSLVFDLVAAACDSGLDACAAEPITDTRPGMTDGLDVLVPQIFPGGYHAPTQRLLIGVQTNWRKFLVAVAADLPPVVLDAESAPNVYSDWFAPTGMGETYLEFDGGPALLTPTLRIAQPRVEGLPVWQVQSLRTYWHDVTLIQAWNGRSLGRELPPGALEAVWFPPEVAPGETLAFDPVHGMLSRIAARGGAFNAWQRPDPDEEGVSGIDVTADLHLCAANPRARRLREYVPRFGRGAPSVTVAPDVVLPGAVAPIDCAYGEDGTLRALVADPPAVWMRAPGPATWVLDASVTVPPAPVRFIRGGASGRGFADIAAKDDPEAGRVVTRAGAVVDILKGTWTLRWNGVPVANLRPVMFFFDFDPTNVNFHTEIPADVAMVERADGRIVMSLQGQDENTFPGPYLYDPRTGSVLRADEGSTFGRFLAVIPGGDNVDPWTGDRLGPPVPNMLVGSPGPAATAAPTGGTAIAAGQSEGCAGGSGADWSAAALAAWLVSLVVARRRRSVA